MVTPIRPKYIPYAHMDPLGFFFLELGSLRITRYLEVVGIIATYMHKETFLDM